MGLQDREWFWEGYEERYDFKTKDEKEKNMGSRARTNSAPIKKTSEEPIAPDFKKINDTLYAYVVCKKCNKKFAAKMKKNKIPKAYILICPYCKQKHWFGVKEFIKKLLLASAIVFVSLLAIEIIYTVMR